MLLKPRYVARFRQVAAVLVRHGFSDVLHQLDLHRFLPGQRAPAASAEEKQQFRARQLRLALEELGATYIKLGQLLSTRPDVLPPPYLVELSALQDRVEPVPFDLVKRTVEEELRAPLEARFASFDPVPAASASLSQVHQALLRPDAAPTAYTGPVAVKVLRPDVERQVEVDLEILAEVARLAARSSVGRRYDIAGIVEQLRLTLTEELDLTGEAHNTEHFREAVAEFPHLRVPAVVRELSTSRVLVLEYVVGTRIPDLPAGVRHPEIADELLRSYLKQVLVDGLFQCDPHPGNFLLDASGRIALLDHGMVARVSRETQLQLTALLLALADGDGARAAEACLDIGIPGDEFNEARFRRDVGQLVARWAGLPLERLDLGQIFLAIVATAFRDDIRIPPELTFLGKTLLNLEGICQRLDPKLEPVEVVRETAASLLGRQFAREVSRTKLLAASLEARAMLLQAPPALRRLLRRAAANELRFGLRLEGEEELQIAVQKVANRIALGLITAALIVGSALLLNVKSSWTVAGYPVFALLGFLLAAGLGLYLIFKVILVDRD